MIRPLGQRVLLEKEENVEKTTASGIVLPDTAYKEEKNIAKVVALGTGNKLEDGTREQFDVSVGDRVIYSKYAATEAEIDDKEYLIIDEKDILAVIE